MHHRGKGNGFKYIVLILIIAPLIWLSQHMGWGDTGTFVCIVVGIVGGWFLLLNGKSITKKLGRTLSSGQKGAAADFLFSPSQPRRSLQEMSQYRQQALTRVGEWNVPVQPMLPPLQKRPPYIESTVTPVLQKAAPTGRQVSPYSPNEAREREARRRTASGGPLMDLGPGAEIYLATTLLSAIVVDATPRRLATPVFIEEWMRIGLGLLVVDVYGAYSDFLAPKLSAGFGFLAGSERWQAHLTALQESRYMRLSATGDAFRVGQSIASEGLQVVLNVPSYQNTVDLGTYLLALLGGIEKSARELPAKPCAIVITDARPLLPEHDEDCLIQDIGVAQQVFDMLMNMLEHAGLQALPKLAIFLSVPTLRGLSDEAIPVCRLWVVNSTDEEVITDISRYLYLDEDELEQLREADTLLFNIPDEIASFARLRHTRLKTQNRPLLPSEERKTEELEEEQEGNHSGESTGLKAREQ